MVVWQSRMLVQECITFYKCRILDFLLAHKFGPGESPRQAPSMRFMLPLWLATCSTSDTFTLPVTTKQDLRPYVSNFPTSIPVPRGSGDGFGIPNPRGSGSVIGADRRRSGPSCVLPKGVPQGQTESGGIVLAANAGPRVPSGGVTHKRRCTYRP